MAGTALGRSGNRDPLRTRIFLTWPSWSRTVTVAHASPGVDWTLVTEPSFLIFGIADILAVVVSKNRVEGMGKDAPKLDICFRPERVSALTVDAENGDHWFVIVVNSI